MSTFWTRFKRMVYLVHRWTGVAACILMALWFVSGVVMLFIGYPKLMPQERLHNLPVLQAAGCCLPVEQALRLAAKPEAVQEIVLTSIAGKPHYRLRQGNGRYLTVDALTGEPAGPVDERRALRAAESYLPGGDPSYRGKVMEDRWTHSGTLNAHRPLHRVQMDDAAHTLLYVSDTTGQVVMDAPRAERAWNYVGAWLHWLYMFRDRPIDPVWSWIVIALSGIGVVAAVTGTLAGLWRWRFSRPYKSGSRSPYRAGYLRWHHLLGLAFAAITCTWIFSGLMSMNPLAIFDAKARPKLTAYRGGVPGTERLALDVPAALSMLERQRFHAVEIEWRVLAGTPFLLARDGGNSTRLIVPDGSSSKVIEQWPESMLLKAGRRAIEAPVASARWHYQYDRYYFHRDQASMYGGAERRLPVLCVAFDNSDKTWLYLDPHTGSIELSSSRAQRTGRWLFNFLHSWDMPSMLDADVARKVALILLSLGGVALSATSVVIAYARLKIWASRLRRKRDAAAAG
ncbi:PepSY domain-containing protein [Pollutimonas sp. M17]|uniref:PepSY domain-containing protein n=1 Tax=Pollutimonas sp. M17 TaxID=2962065 RepID=UPI0021F4982E|nr:PepSY domain-containing protein [Pollutimonas sp. M17]UYO93237.1 PepSY domain-containing protein [Pollutimonas sp. M17]